MKTSIVIACCVVAFSVAVQADESDLPMAPVQTRVSVRSETVGVRDVAESVTVFGTVAPAPAGGITIAAPRESRVAKVFVRSGQRVRRGAALIALAASPRAGAAYRQAAADVRYAKTARERVQKMYTDKLATRTDLAAAQKNLASAEAELDAARQAGGGGTQTVRAPSDGVISGLAVESGTRVSADTPLLRFAGTSRLEIHLRISPGVATRLAPGMPLALWPVFGNGKTVQTKLAGVGGAVDQGGMVSAYAPLPAKGKWISGDTLTGRVNLRIVHALAVPHTALLHDEAGDYVFIVLKGRAHRINVKTLADDGHWYAVGGDLEAGEHVVVTGNYELDENMVVQEPSR